jgi:hypothetical protein
MRIPSRYCEDWGECTPPDYINFGYTESPCDWNAPISSFPQLTYLNLITNYLSECRSSEIQTWTTAAARRLFANN